MRGRVADAVDCHLHGSSLVCFSCPTFEEGLDYKSAHYGRVDEEGDRRWEPELLMVDG